MPRLSTYSNFDYPDGEERIMPWEFWTEQERSLVIKQGYKDFILNSSEVKPYLDASRIHFYSQWIVPIAAAGLCFGPLRGTVLANLYKKHPNIGYKWSGAIFGGFTILWLNLSPFYIQKENQQVRALKTIWSKVGPGMKGYNDMISKKTTSTNLDKDTWELYSQRNSRWAGITCPQEDSAPYFLQSTKATNQIKRKFL